MTAMTSSATGTITRRSRSAASSKSCWIACPRRRAPRLAGADRPGCRAAGPRARARCPCTGRPRRSTLTVAIAPSSDRCGSPTVATPAIALEALPHLDIRLGGLPALALRRGSRWVRARPAGTLARAPRSPSTLSTSVLKKPVVRVVLLVGEEAEREERRRERWSRAAPGRGAEHPVADAAPDPLAARELLLRPVGDGLRGQKPRRPTIVSRAGSSVMPASSAHATPIADTGPSELVDPVSASSSTSIEAITVQPLASIARARRAAARVPSPRACPRCGAAPRGSGSRAAGNSRCPRRTSAPRGSPVELPVTVSPASAYR